MMKGLVLVILLALGIHSPTLAKELKPLEELLELALVNNLDLRIKKQEITNYRVSDGVFEKVRFTSSYNFETNSSFVGVIASIPIAYFKTYREELRYRDLLFQKECQRIFNEVENLYYQYQKLSRTRKELKLDLKRRQIILRKREAMYEADKIGVEELISRQIEVLEVEHKLMGLEDDMKKLQDELARIVGTPVYAERSNN